MSETTDDDIPVGGRARESAIPLPAADGTPTWVAPVVQHDDRWHACKAELERLGVSMDWEGSSTAMLAGILRVKQQKMHYEIGKGPVKETPIEAQAVAPPVDDEFKSQVTQALKGILEMGRQLAATIDGLASRVEYIEEMKMSGQPNMAVIHANHPSRKKQKQVRR